MGKYDLLPPFLIAATTVYCLTAICCCYTLIFISYFFYIVGFQVALENAFVHFSYFIDFIDFCATVLPCQPKMIHNPKM